MPGSSNRCRMQWREGRKVSEMCGRCEKRKRECSLRMFFVLFSFEILHTRFYTHTHTHPCFWQPESTRGELVPVRNDGKTAKHLD